jgi:hypothetical protein
VPVCELLVLVLLLLHHALAVLWLHPLLLLVHTALDGCVCAQRQYSALHVLTSFTRDHIPCALSVHVCVQISAIQPPLDAQGALALLALHTCDVNSISLRFKH